MNKDQVSGAFLQLRGKVKKAWGELTDDDIAKAEGSVDKLYGIIQERFGDTKEAIQAKINSIRL